MNKTIVSFIILIASFHFIMMGQTEFRGINGTGFDSGIPLPRRMGAFFWFDARMGVTTSSSTRRVQSWTDQSGNGFVLNNYSNSAALNTRTAPPLFTNTVNVTNTFPCLDFTLPNGTSSPRRLRTFGAMPQAYTGIDKPYTFMYFGCTVTNGTQTYAFSVCDPVGAASTNGVNGTHMALNPTRTGLTQRWYYQGDTNRGAQVIVTQTHNYQLTNFFWSTIVFDGTTAQMYNNLTPAAAVTPTTQGMATFTCFNLGGNVRTNDSGTDLNGYNYVSVVVGFTNAVDGTGVTNLLNYFNKYYPTFP